MPADGEQKMSTGGLTEEIRKMKVDVKSRRKLDFPEFFRRAARSHPYVIFMLAARKLFFGILFLVVVSIMIYFLSLR
jgi:hypothetical protein